MQEAKKRQTSPTYCCETSKTVPNMSANNYYFTPLPLLIATSFHLFTSYYVSIYLLWVALDFIIMEKDFLYKRSSCAPRLPVCDGLCSQFRIPEREGGEGGAPHVGIAREKSWWFFFPLTNLALDSINSCWLQLSWQVILPETSVHPEESEGNEQGKFSSVSNCRGLNAGQEAHWPNSECFMTLSITWH